MVRPPQIKAYIGILRHTAAQLSESACELADEASSKRERAEALDGLAEALEACGERTPATVDAMVDFFTGERLAGSEPD